MHDAVVGARKIAFLAFDFYHPRTGMREPVGAKGCRHRLFQRNDKNIFQIQHTKMDSLERLGQAEHMRRDIRQYQVGRYRRDLVKPGLPELAFDIVLDREAVTAMSLQAHVRGGP